MPTTISDFPSILTTSNNFNDNDVVSVNEKGDITVEDPSSRESVTRQLKSDQALINKQFQGEHVAAKAIRVERRQQTEAANRKTFDAFISHLEKNAGQLVGLAKKMDIGKLRTLRETGGPLRVRHIKAALKENKPPSRGQRVVSVGGGPRGVSQTNEEIAFLVNHRKDFEALEKLGGTYEMATVVFDKGDFNAMGRGAAWTDQNEGTVNTGAESGNEGRLSKYSQTNKEDILEYLKGNPVARGIFASAFTEGDAPGPVTHRAALTRALQGREELEHFKDMLRLFDDEELASIYNLVIMTETEVTGIDLSNPKKPVVATGAERWPVDTVRLNTGTTLASPLGEDQAEVRKHAYIGPMQAAGLKEVMAKNNLLDGHDMLIPGKKILTGGSGLSLYDQLLALHSVMDLFEEEPASPTGYKITDAAKEKYGGSILVTSNTPGKWISPRHSHGAAWTQEVDPIAGIKEQHALFLHNQGEEVFNAWQDILVGTFAAATGRTPEQVRQEGLTTEQLLRAQHVETEKHAQALKDKNGKAEQTLYGARRQGYLSTTLGFGMERDLPKATADMYAMAPGTFKGREGYLMHRAQLKGISEPGTEVSKDNKELVSVLNTRMQDITASPFRVHEMMLMLMDAGIAKYTPGSYRKITAGEAQQRPLSFTDSDGAKTEHDLFLVSPTFQRGENPAVASLRGQVDPVHASRPNYGRVGPHRMLQKDGASTHVEDYGLGGKGVRVDNSSVLGLFANDVNNRESATQIAPGLAFRRFAQEALAIAGHPDPVGEVERLYEDLSSGAKDVDEAEKGYQDEVEKFREHYQSAMEKAAYLKIIGEAMNNPEYLKHNGMNPEEPAVNYNKLFEAGRTREGREKYGGEKYTEAVKQIPEYRPASRQDYFTRFVDSPDFIHEAVYTKASLLAAQSLLEPRMEQEKRGGQTGSVDWPPRSGSSAGATPSHGVHELV